jgi:hypothetical protein
MTKPLVGETITPDLKKVLRQLKLGQMLDTLPERLTQAKQQHLTHAGGAPAPPGSTPACAWTPGTTAQRYATTTPYGTS